MSPLRLASLCALLLLSAALLVSASSSTAAADAPASVSLASAGSLTHTSVSRVVDLRTHIEEVTLTLSVKNTGSSPVSSYIVALPSGKAPRLAYIEASPAKDAKTKLPVSPVSVTGLPSLAAEPEAAAALKNASFHAVSFSSPLAAGASLDLKVVLVFTRTQRPFPERIEQSENQLVMWEDSSVLFSPYVSSSQETVVKLYSGSGARVESHTKKGGKKVGDELRYPTSESVAPFSTQVLQVHAVNNAPFVTFTSLSKDIEVSHWGNVAVQDNVWLSHTGAKLKGAFTRFDYERSRGGDSAPASFRTLVAELPRTATDIYYRDCIGNVSTSHVRKASGHTRVEIDPRFPMFGGWSSDFMLGYNVPSQHYLFKDDAESDRYVLDIPFGAPFSSAAIDELTVRIILPEGAEDIHWSTPFHIDSASMTSFKTYLDTTGRPTLILSKSNAVRHHAQHFRVAYRFAKLSILREPLLITGAVMACLAVVMAFYHADLRIVDDESSGSSAGSSSSGSSSANVEGSRLKTRRIGTALGAQVQEILENILARPNGFLSLAETRAPGPAKQTLLATVGQGLGQALRRVEKEDSSFAPVVAPLLNSITLAQKASAKYVSAVAQAEIKTAREGLAAIVEQIHEQAQKLAQL